MIHRFNEFLNENKVYDYINQFNKDLFGYNNVLDEDLRDILVELEDLGFYINDMSMESSTVDLLNKSTKLYLVIKLMALRGISLTEDDRNNIYYTLERCVKSIERKSKTKIVNDLAYLKSNIHKESNFMKSGINLYFHKDIQITDSILIDYYKHNDVKDNLEYTLSIADIIDILINGYTSDIRDAIQYGEYNEIVNKLYNSHYYDIDMYYDIYKNLTKDNKIILSEYLSIPLDSIDYDSMSAIDDIELEDIKELYIESILCNGGLINGLENYIISELKGAKGIVIEKYKSDNIIKVIYNEFLYDYKTYNDVPEEFETVARDYIESLFNVFDINDLDIDLNPYNKAMDYFNNELPDILL